jgi:2-iminobutanoate/2-iminopropanoate deaminase
MPAPPEPYRRSPTNRNIGEIHTEPERVADMPYAPAVRVEAPGDLLFVSGATPSPLYHKHPHDWSEHDHPNDIREQTRRAMRTIESILRHEDLAWTDVVKMTKYLTDMREIEVMSATLKEFLGDWSPASTTVCVNSLSTPGARIEIDVIAVFPKE